MKSVLLNIILSFILLLKSMIVNSQIDNYENLKKNTVYFEFIGNAVFYSINYDRLFDVSEKFKMSSRIGFHYSDNLFGNKNKLIGSPIEISGMYSIIKNKHFLEIGPGLTYLNNLNLSNNHIEDLIILALRIGYRYQKPDGGLFFKLGFVPLYDWYVFNPDPWTKHHSWFMSGGLGIGYTF